MRLWKPSARSTAIALLAICALALPACSSNSTKPSTAPTQPSPPPAVNCDHTPPPALLSKVPPLLDAAGLPELDAWITQAIGQYQTEVSIRVAEHACMDKLRAGGVIQ